MVTSHRVVVFDAKLHNIISVGDGYRWTKRQAHKVRAVAETKAPSRSGRLRASHGVQQNRNMLGQYQTGFYVYADAPHAAFVHEGTGIYGPRGQVIDIGKMMRIPPSRVGVPWAGPKFIRRSRGQRGNPWLADAAREATGV